MAEAERTQDQNDGMTNDELEDLAKRYLKTTAVLDIHALDSTVLNDKGINDYLITKGLDWVCIFENQDLLFYPKKKEQIFELQNLVKVLKSKGMTRVRPRPAAREVINFARNRAGGPGAEASADRVTKRRQRRIELAEVDNERSDVQKLLDALISAADRAGTSDVHIETNEEADTAKIRYRIDGDAVDQTITALQWREQDAVSMASMIINYESHSGGGSAKDAFDRNKPIDGSFTVKTNGRKVKLRYSHQPTNNPVGLSIVLRILTGSGDGQVPGYEELGYSATERALQERAFRYPHGIVLYTGPTGSGKSTAMAAGVKTIPSTKKVLSYEDPVEASLPGVNQIQVGSTKETSFSAYARAALRQDPDVIIYGEIRDADVMRNSIHQANTGHLVLSTLHTNTAPEAIQRMADLGCEWDRLGSPSLIRAIIAQRLVKKLCQTCAVPLKTAVELGWATEDHYRLHDFFEKEHPEGLNHIKTVNRGAHKCPDCKEQGESGRLPLVEIIILDEHGREFVKAGDILGWTNYLKTQGWKSLAEKAMDRILRGEVCPASVESSLETPFGISAQTFDYREFEEQTARYAAEKKETIKKRVVDNNVG